jgi:plasmid stabilization system protein ParE
VATIRFTRLAEADLLDIDLYVFYREEPGGILVSRILHERMLPEKQAMEDEAEN